MAKIITPTRHILVTLGVLTSLATVTAPAQKALGDKPSTPVTVVNPSTGPALTSSIDNPGRIPYQSEAVVSCGSGASSSCQFSFAAVPQGQRLVVQHVSGSLSFNNPPDAVAVALSGSNVIGGGGTTINPGGAQFFASSVDNISMFDQQVLYYMDGGSLPVVSVTLVVASSGGSAGSGLGAGKVSVDFTSGDQFVTLTGYLLNCTASPCASIAR
jgi:hypothetical protein